MSSKQIRIYDVSNYRGETVWRGTATDSTSAVAKAERATGIPHANLTWRSFLGTSADLPLSSRRSNPSPRYRKTAKRRNPSDAQVIKAFTERRAASSSKLHTDGRRLDGLWMGGNGIAVWEGGKIHFSDLGSKAAQAVQRAVAKEAPRNWIGAGSEWALPKKRNPLSPYAKYQRAQDRKMGIKPPPKPKFKIGNWVEDNYGDGDLQTRPGRVTFVGSYTAPYVAYEKGGVSYEGFSGGYKYKVEEPDGRTLWRDEQRLRRIKAPRKRNPPSSGLGGTYIVTHANPRRGRRNPDLSGPLTITHDGPDIHITHKANPRRRKR